MRSTDESARAYVTVRLGREVLRELGEKDHGIKRGRDNVLKSRCFNDRSKVWRDCWHYLRKQTAQFFFDFVDPDGSTFHSSGPY